MRVLIVKTSSMGDIIHTLPAITDAIRAIPDITFDWVVEKNFAEIPLWHPGVNKIIPLAWRQWRKKLWASATRAEAKIFYQTLRREKYDVVLDAQGLVKSALCACLARGLRLGPDRVSAREPVAAFLYQKTFSVPQKQHAIIRMRSLFSQALKYKLPLTPADYGLKRQQLISAAVATTEYVVFLHGTTWDTKHWPEHYWSELAKKVTQQGVAVKLPWGNAAEQARALRIASDIPHAEVLPKMDLNNMASLIAGAKAIVAVDTGLGHLAAALNVSTISLFGPTDPILTGAQGQLQTHLSAQFPCAPCLSKVCLYEKDSPLFPPCFGTLTPDRVAETLLTLL